MIKFIVSECKSDDNRDGDDHHGVFAVMVVKFHFYTRRNNRTLHIHKKSGLPSSF